MSDWARFNVLCSEIQNYDVRPIIVLKHNINYLCSVTLFGRLDSSCNSDASVLSCYPVHFKLTLFAFHDS